LYHSPGHGQQLGATRGHSSTTLPWSPGALPGFHGGTIAGWFISMGKYQSKMDDLEVPLFQETPIKNISECHKLT